MADARRAREGLTLSGDMPRPRKVGSVAVTVGLREAETEPSDDESELIIAAFLAEIATPATAGASSGQGNGAGHADLGTETVVALNV